MRDANQGEDRSGTARPREGDLTQGPIVGTLLRFSIPTMIANLLQTLGGTINTIWVGQLIGGGAVAATANANLVVFLFIAAVFGCGMAATVRIGQRFGARDIDGARRSFGSGTGFCTLAATAAATLCFIFGDQMLKVLGTPQAIHDDALIYLHIVLISLPFGAASMVVSMGLRGAGDAKTPLYAMILSTVVGMILNPWFILGWGPIPAMGIGGSALANAIGAFTGVVVMVSWIYWRDLPLRLKGRELLYLIPDRAELSYIVAKGLPMGAQTMITSAAGILMFGMVNREGLTAAAAYAAVLQIWNYIQMPAFSIGTGVSAMVAQSMGAGDHARVGEVTRAGVMTNIFVTGGLAMVILLFDAPLLGLFLGHGSPAVALAEHVQLIGTWTFVLTGIVMVLNGTMRSYGVVVTQLIVMVIAMYPARLGFYWLAYPWLGIEAVWWSYPVGSIMLLVLTLLSYNFGGWRKKQAQFQPALAA